MDRVERNVPREQWLYPDRGMMNWMGWILSDHSKYLEQAAATDHPVPELPAQAPATIHARLQTAWEHSRSVSIQLNSRDFDAYAPNTTGVVLGLYEGQTTLQLTSGKLATVATDTIRHVDLVAAKKWWRDG